MSHYLEEQRQKDQQSLFSRAALWVRENETAGKPPQYWLCFGEGADRSRGLTQLQSMFPDTYQLSNRIIDKRRYFFINLSEETGKALMTMAESEKRLIDTSRAAQGRRMIGKEGREMAAEELEAILKRTQADIGL